MAQKKRAAASGKRTEVDARIARAREANFPWLDLSSCGLQQVPEALRELTQIRSVDLTGNRIAEVPGWLGAHHDFLWVRLHNNPIRADGLREVHINLGLSIDAETVIRCDGQLPRDKVSVTVAESDAAAFAEYSDQRPTRMSALRDLTLGDWSLHIGAPRQAPSRPMQRLIDGLHACVDLESLSIRGLKLSKVPESIAGLSKLKYLSLDGTPGLVLPEWLQDMRLESLNLTDNALEALPAWLSRLKSLRCFRAAFNNLAAFPPALLEMDALVEISLENNQLTQVPADILRLQQLNSLDVRGNPLETPPAEVCSGGLQAIRDYWRQREESGVDYLSEAKLIIVGEAGAGKTTLARKIMNPGCPLDRDQLSTEGIDIHRWQFPATIRARDGSEGGRLLQRDFQVNIWDFGGQEIYHATHQFFLTRRSLYVLLCDDRKEDTSFSYWLQVVDMLSDASPLLIVQNEKQDRTRDINLQALRARFANLRQAMPTNLASGRGLPELLDLMRSELQALPQVGQALPATWKRVRDALEQDPRDFISLDEYLRICGQHGFTRRDDKLQLSSFLHDLGICLHFQGDATLKNTVILEPRWATAAVYRALDDAEVIRARGRFTRADLSRIWSEERYRDMHDELLRLMMKFELCYSLDEPDAFMAPQLLATERPACDWNMATGSIELRYLYAFMPKGLVTRFIVAMNRLIAGGTLMWRSGVVLERNGTRAELMEYHEEGDARPCIRVRIVGRDARGLMAIIDEQLERLHASFPRLQYDRELPCPCPDCAQGGRPFRFALRVLAEAARRGKQLQCHHSYEMVDASALVRDILPHVSLAEATVAIRQEPPSVSTFAEREVFVSYSADATSRPVVKQLHAKLAEQGVRVFDYKKDIAYRQSVGEFMKRLGEAGCVIVILTDKYLRSEYCMFELLEIAAADSFQDRVFPIVLPDAKLYDASDRIGYVEHWEQQEEKLDGKLKGVRGAKLQNLQRTRNLYADVRNLFDDLTDRLADMNALTPEEHENSGYEQLVAAVIERLGHGH